MGNTESKKPGTKMSVANPPNKNGNGPEWENFGTLFLDPSGKRGTFYLRASVGQLENLLKSAKDGQVSRKVGVFLRKGDASSTGGGESAPAVPQAAAA